MPAFKSARLVVKGYWGDVRPPLAFNITAPSALRAAKRNGSIKNLVLLRDGDAEDSDLRGICLGFKVVFPEGVNDLSRWSASVTESVPDFRQSYHFGAKGLGYARQSGTASTVTFTTGSVETGALLVGKNMPFSVQVFIPKPPKELKYPVFTLARWGEWQVQLLNGSPHGMRRKATWTQTDEDTLNTLLAVENPTLEQQQSIDEQRAALYDDYTALSALGSGDDWYGRDRTLTFIPELRGVLNVFDGFSWATVRQSAILKTRKNGKMWPQCRVTLGSNGGAFFWRGGYPQFVLSGELLLAPYRTAYWQTVFDTLQTTKISAEGGMLPGTSTSISNFVGEFWSQIKTTLTTTNSRYTPFLYAASAYIPAGERDGSATTVWDSGAVELADANNHAPILDVQPRFEGDTRRQSYVVTVRDMEGSTFSGVGPYRDSLQFRVCDFYFDDDLVIENGIIKTAELGDIMTGEYELPRSLTVSPLGIVTFEICDQWAVVDIMPIDTPFVGDGLLCGGLMRRALNSAGTKETDMADLGDDLGAPVPSAIAGEPWATMPAQGVMVGDYTRQSCAKHGNGRVPQRGVSSWTLNKRPTSVATIEGYAAEFTSDHTQNDNRSYPGRLAILGRIKFNWDWVDYATIIDVFGGEDSEGNQLAARWKNKAGIVAMALPLQRFLVGLPRKVIESDSGLRTMNDVHLARRSLAEEFGAPPRFGAFETYFHRGLFPGDLIRVDGTLCRIIRVPDGSWREDLMQIAYRELYEVTPE